MSLFHRSDHALTCSPSTPLQPLVAAFCDAASADASGACEVRAVSMPTYFVKSYERPDWTEKLSASVAVRLFAVGSNFRLGAPTPLASSVDATVPAVPSVWVAKFTSMESAPDFVAFPPVCTSRRAPSPSIVSVTVAGPLQCGTIVMWTAPTRGSARSATTS